ncbi:NUDIX hydrolase [Azospirillum doebereinerae]|uniref:NUDIX hydrolase n=1 Tax=Azospirillum doebereinerae TaxID=92933 RepID=A0A3S0VED8_9PROT|nr:NUDIX domain-containing protein [Azospirillum doebereinerae]MCG5243955.1 NUDIX domain-containing protein [Azospirillum doebereinerae]RUQ63295.1 NUDIX hydrolase [Azospirillum doebereinerae]
MTTLPVEPRPAASLVLLRDGAEGLELFMIERHGGLRFAPGATVFPGGRLEGEDHAPGWRRFWPDGAAPADLPQRVAALREAFEECGLLLTDDPPDAARLESLRRAMAAGRIFAEALDEAALVPAPARAVPFSRWVTPDTLPRRFDTLFLLARLPPGQTPVMDGGEAVAGRWTTPRRILADADAGTCRLVFVTRMILLRLAGCADPDSALRLAAGCDLSPIQPGVVETPAGPVFRIPAGCGFHPIDTPVEKVTLG